MSNKKELQMPLSFVAPFFGGILTCYNCLISLCYQLGGLGVHIPDRKQNLVEHLSFQTVGHKETGKHPRVLPGLISYSIVHVYLFPIARHLDKVLRTQPKLLKQHPGRIKAAKPYRGKSFAKANSYLVVAGCLPYHKHGRYQITYQRISLAASSSGKLDPSPRYTVVVWGS